MKSAGLLFASAMLAVDLAAAAGFFATRPGRARSVPPATIARERQDGATVMSTRSRYKMDINALDRLLDAREEEKLEEIRALLRVIQETRKNSPEVALPRRVRDALADYRRAGAKYGRHSREAKITHQHFLDVSNSMQPPRAEGGDTRDALATREASAAASALEELKEIACLEKSVMDRMMDRFGAVDLEIGEGFLERGIEKEDPDAYGLWP